MAPWTATLVPFWDQLQTGRILKSTDLRVMITHGAQDSLFDERHAEWLEKCNNRCIAFIYPDRGHDDAFELDDWRRFITSLSGPSAHEEPGKEE